ncbi:hypothetical protein [Clostridium saccharobutylicum]|uniref:Uncharacterized protein n=1 Tax=Clostridium saccharobutylicum TaxID=169679 RepID=A0A1S8NIU4_CLOSA|nr:hypothetical protein [Clostridium saccharobutylicum]OOM16370.1 hypothetical protein CLOSAC_06410 [Clostridium saccharobutylicum]
MEQYNKIIYFFDSYYLMLDYNQTLNQIVNEFIENETEETTNEIISQMDKALNDIELQEKTLSEIITNCIEMNTTPEQMFEMIKEIYYEFKSKIKIIEG